MKTQGNQPIWLTWLDKCTERYYWRLLIGGRLIADSTFRLISQVLYQFAIVSFRLFELPAFIIILPLIRFLTNGSFALVLMKRALSDKNLPKWDMIFNLISACIFLGLGIAYLGCAWAMQPFAVFILILVTNVWDFLLEIKGYTQRGLKTKALRTLLNQSTDVLEKRRLMEELKHIERQNRIQSWFVISVILTLVAVGFTLAAIINPVGFLAVNLVYFSSITFLITGITSIIHGKLQHENDILWKNLQSKLTVAPLSKSQQQTIYDMVHTHSNPKLADLNGSSASITPSVSPVLNQSQDSLLNLSNENKTLLQMPKPDNPHVFFKPKADSLPLTDSDLRRLITSFPQQSITVSSQ